MRTLISSVVILFLLSGCQSENRVTSEDPRGVENTTATNTVDQTANTVDSPATEIGEETKYNDAQLHKNGTLLVLTYPADIRADFLIKGVRPFVTPAQIIQAKNLALTYDERYVQLRQRRAEILENATDNGDVEAQLLALKKEIADLNLAARLRIKQEIFTPEQQQAAQAFNRSQRQ